MKGTTGPAGISLLRFEGLDFFHITAAIQGTLQDGKGTKAKGQLYYIDK